MKRIKVGIIGQGRSGRNIHRLLMETEPEVWERFELVAISDPIKERWSFPSTLPVSPKLKCYEDCHEMLKDKRIELIVNSSRTPGHAPLSIEAMKAGFNVLCEKPAAPTLKEFDKAIAVSKKTGRFYNIYQQSRFRTVFVKVRELMESGIIGRVSMVRIYYNGFGRRWDWQTIQDMCAGELLNTGPHPLDQALALYGDGYPEQIFCTMDRLTTYGDAEDSIKLVFGGKGHPTIDMEVYKDGYPESVYHVYGTLGTIKATGDTVTWKYYKPEENITHTVCQAPLEGDGRLPVYCSEKLHMYEESYKVPERMTAMHPWGVEYYKQLYAALTEGKPMDVTLEQVRRQIRLIEECHAKNPLNKKFHLKGERL